MKRNIYPGDLVTIRDVDSVRESKAVRDKIGLIGQVGVIESSAPSYEIIFQGDDFKIGQMFYVHEIELVFSV